MSVAPVRRIVVAACLAAALGVCGALVSAAEALAGTPWWHVNTVSAPAGQPGGESMLLLEVSNLGDAPVNGFAHPVSIEDNLPAGVTVSSVHGEGGGSSPIGIKGVKTVLNCGVAGQAVSCTYPGPLLAYERFIIVMMVEASPGAGRGVSEVSVSGGGATPVVRRQALALDEPAPGFGAQNYELTPEEEGGAVDTRAGSHPFQLTISLTFNTKAAMVFNSAHLEMLPEVQPTALPKELAFVLPPGLIGNPAPLPKCRLSVFMKQSNTSRCPDQTAIGVATPILTNTAPADYGPLAEAVPVYSVEPAVGEPARFGFNTQDGPVVLDTSVRTGSDYGVVVSVPDIPDDFGLIGSQVTFWGVPADPRHDTSRGECLDKYEGTLQEAKVWEFACPVQERPQPFLIMPTSCTGPWQTTVDGEPWENIGVLTALREYTLSDDNGIPIGQDGCNHLSFTPTISVTPDGQGASTPSGLTVKVHVDQEASLNPTGLADASVRNTTVALPAGVALNPAGANGLSACSEAQIGYLVGESNPPETMRFTPSEPEPLLPGVNWCPESSKIGTVDIHTPLLEHDLTGSVYLASPAPSEETGQNPFNTLIAIYIVAKDPVSGVLVKLAGKVEPDLVTGQLVSTFTDTPQLPFEDLYLSFFGGSRAPLGTPALCGSYTTTASIAPWSGNPTSELVSPPFQITSGPNGSSCSDPLPFSPSLTTGSTNIQAGAFTPFTMTMSREDGNQNLDAIRLHMPLGLSGLLTGVELCGEAQANAGTCGPNSLIGETTVSVGLGGNPYTVKGGKVYITGPYEGAPFGLSIVNPAKAGPFDLGQVIVRAKIEVDPTTAALTVTSDTTGSYAIPQMIRGIPLQIKHVNVTINRPGFTFNPTNCEPMKVTGALTSSQGATSGLAVPFQVTNCATLGFKPSFRAATSAKTSRANGASLNVKVSYPHGSLGSRTNLRSVKVDLPKQLPSRLTTLQKACPHAAFEANPASCPSESVVGHAVVHTQLIPVPLTGPAYFVSYGGEEFPKLIIVLQGYGVTIDLVGNTFIKHGVTSSTFRSTPDTPFESFELTFPEGKFSALAANGNLCTAGQTITVSKRVKRRVHGRLKTVTVKVKKNGPGLVMPIALTAQNGAVIHQNTRIRVTGCPKAHKAKHKKGKKKKR